MKMPGLQLTVFRDAASVAFIIMTQTVVWIWVYWLSTSPLDMFNCQRAVDSSPSSSYVIFTCPPALTILSLSWFVKLIMSACPPQVLIQGSQYTDLPRVWQDSLIWQLEHNQGCATVNILSWLEQEEFCLVLFSYGNSRICSDSNLPISPLNTHGFSWPFWPFKPE